MSSNTFTIVGNLTKEPELRFSNKNVAVCNVTIASTKKKFNKQTNEFEDGDTIFMRGTVFGEFAEHVAATLRKGQRVIAVGELKQNQYETESGEKRTSTELKVDALGPDLRYATATVVRADQNSTPTSDWVAQPAEPAAWDSNTRF